jgi:hypothetical protein
MTCAILEWVDRLINRRPVEPVGVVRSAEANTTQLSKHRAWPRS